MIVEDNTFFYSLTLIIPAMQNATQSKPVSIDKENIGGLKFPETDVLKTKDDIQMRIENLERALKLGNLEHNKIKIIFEDNEGLKL